MTFSMFILLSCAIWIANAATPVPEPAEYALSYSKKDNPLNITVVDKIEDNYFIILGDWGAHSDDSTDEQVQKGVAAKMKKFYDDQKNAGKHLMFVIAVGDNFYHTGMECDTQNVSVNQWQYAWKDIYSSGITDVPWLGMYGNHDYGNSDYKAICAWKDPIYIDPNTNIPYAAHQLNKDKGGCNPDNYYIPDFGYVYTINKLKFELIAMDQAYTDCPNGIGGHYSAASKVWSTCGSNVTACKYLKKIATSTENMMKDRAKNSKNFNFILAQHFPVSGKSLKSSFESVRGGSNGKDYFVWSVYGHSHNQRCDYKGNVHCTEILSGGGGGCCSDDSGHLQGFYPIFFNSDAQMVQKYDVTNSAITCEFPCSDNAEFVDEVMANMEYNQLYTCCHTIDTDTDCSKFNLLTQCDDLY